MSLPVTGPHQASHDLTATHKHTSIEEKLHHSTQIKRIRVSEFFKDFDPLRSGFITCETVCVLYCIMRRMWTCVVLYICISYHAIGSPLITFHNH